MTGTALSPSPDEGARRNERVACGLQSGTVRVVRRLARLFGPASPARAEGVFSVRG
jgi:hypothetical protein